jgi:diguanylate cyclase (GGDEF)-like protein
MGTGKKKYTIGFLFDYLYEDYTNQIFNNILKTCREYDLNFIGFGGGTLKSAAYKYRDQKNVVFDLAGSHTIDGIIALTGVFGNFVSHNRVKTLLGKYAGLPVVSIGLSIRGMKNVTNVVVDNNSGMEALLAHLIETHNRRRLAFIKGAFNNYDAIMRFESYKRVLARYNIPLDNDLIIDGNFDYFYGIEAVKILLEKRKITPDALVSANDAMAIYAMHELQKRGFRVPEDIVVTGFDDIRMCLAVKPRLTTIKQSFTDIGRVSVETILAMLSGESVPENIVLPSKLIIRESCGCSELETLDDIMRVGSAHRRQTMVVSGRNGIKDVIQLALPNLSGAVDLQESMDDLLKSDHNKNSLLLVFRRLFIRLFEQGVELDDVYRFSLLLFHAVAENPARRGTAQKLTAVWPDILVLAGIINNNYHSGRRVELRKEEEVVFRINEEFINTFNLSQLKKIILSQLPKLPIRSLYLCMYENQNRDSSRLFLHYSLNGKKQRLKRGTFLSHHLLPTRLDTTMGFEYVVMALYFKREHFGYILFEISTSNGSIYETLATQISSAIKGAMLTREINEYTHTLKQKVQERTGELEDANRKLKELDSVKNDFIANITHDFRSPLTAVLNIADLALKSRQPVPERIAEDFKIIYDASVKLKKTIDRLLDLAKMDAQGITLRVGRVALVSMLESIIDFYSSSVIGSGIKIIKKLPEHEIADFYTDAEKFEEVINNLMSNAVKFVDPESGIISIELQDRDDRVVIIVEDNGIGIPPEKLDVIFNRFEQVHKEKNSFYRGTGIGLAFARQLVTYMKGEIRAESAGRGMGSRFIMVLKKGRAIFSEKDFYNGEISTRTYNDDRILIQTDIKTRLERQEIFAHLEDLNKEGEFDYRKGKILIIEDDINIRKIIAQYLLQNSYRNFIQAANGKQGLEAVYEYHPDLIICDYNMPEMKGDVFHDTILANPNFRHIPCIFLSAIADDKIITERRRKGAGAYLKKPIDEKDFLLTVDQHLQKYFEYLETVRLATIDELTGLQNKRAVYKGLAHELFIRRYRDLSVMFMDLDHFKNINDTYGHPAGDTVLAATGELLRSSLRNYDIAGRYGGDEFIIILPETNLKNAIAVAQGLREKLTSRRVEYDGKAFGVTASLGVASLRDNAGYVGDILHLGDLKDIFEVRRTKQADWEKIEREKLKIADLLVKMADRALYTAKQTSCGGCGYASTKQSHWHTPRCPRCGGTEIIRGRNRVVAFSGAGPDAGP